MKSAKPVHADQIHFAVDGAELLVGGVLIGIPVGLAAWFVARRVLLRRAAAQGAGAVSRG